MREKDGGLHAHPQGPYPPASMGGRGWARPSVSLWPPGRGVGQADLQQAMSSSLQWIDGTHRLEEPVSKTTVKHCGGVPMPISP